MSQHTKSIMIQGTMSNAGKSILAAGLCRIFHQDGYRTAPFKSQNMALNSYITPEGLEMGRAQAVQAEAAGIVPSADMNPILLKPTTDVGSQVIVHGVSRGNMKARDYFACKKSLVPDIMASYRRLEEQYDVIVIEGAGSPAEINLKSDDIVNMGMADMADAPVLLVGDIDRGGVFAQLYGTVALLTEEERKRIKGLIINKFRGDRSILEPGISMLEDLCGIPVVGVVPYMDVDIEDEDSLSSRLETGKGKAPAAVDLAVIRFPRISNFTDFSPLESHPALGVRYVERAGQLGEPDLVVLPGTKNTMGDLAWMRQNGLEAAVKKLAAAGTPVLGVCGGYQMLGTALDDPDGVEQGGRMDGMGLLPCATRFTGQKVRTRVQACAAAGPFAGAQLDGYEIHMGETIRDGGRNFSEICCSDGTGGHTADTKEDGCIYKNVFGTYVHGVFDTEEMQTAVRNFLAKQKGVCPEEYESGVTFSMAKYKEEQYDKMAKIIRENLDMDMIYRILERKDVRG